MKFGIFLILVIVLLIGCSKLATDENVAQEEGISTKILTPENITSDRTCFLNYEIRNISFELSNDTSAPWQCIGTFRVSVENKMDESITLEIGLWMTRYLKESYQIPWFYWERHFRVGGSNPDSIIMTPTKIEIDADSAAVLEFNYTFDYCSINEGINVNYGIVYGKENLKQEMTCK